MSFFKRLRHFYMGLLTLMPGPPKGWFIPYRYASTVSPPNNYPALEPIFKSAESDFRSFLKEIDLYYTDLFAIGSDPLPQPRWEHSQAEAGASLRVCDAKSPSPPRERSATPERQQSDDRVVQISPLQQ